MMFGGTLQKSSKNVKHFSHGWTNIVIMTDKGSLSNYGMILL